MGASNAMQVYTHWTHLGHREARLLTYLALVSLDDGRPPVYFGGWAAAAQALGLDPEGNPRSAQENVRKSFKVLTSRGAVVPSGVAHSGRRAEYALTLDPARSVLPSGSAMGAHGRAVTLWTPVERGTGHPVDKSRRIWESPTETVGQCPTELVGLKPHRTGGESPTELVGPRKNEEPHQEHGEENIALDVSTGPVHSLDRRKQFEAAAQFLAQRPDHGEDVLSILPRYGFEVSEHDRVLAAARLAGWTGEGAA